MENKILKKYLTIAVVCLFAGMTITPVITAESQKEDTKTTTLKLKTIDKNGESVEKTINVEKEQIQNLKSSLIDLIQQLMNAENTDEMMSKILEIVNMQENHPILSKILKFMLDRGILQDTLLGKIIPLRGSFIVSQGWCYKLNILKDSKFRLATKPLFFWRYAEKSQQNDVDSQTYRFKLNTFSPEVTVGRQIGLMTRFKGVYVYEANPINQQSYTLFLGLAKNANAMELPTFSNNTNT
ncbi:MAG: hypothetical protein V5A68_03405 [Candidatus Thermoplasmatota archaeon]